MHQCLQSHALSTRIVSGEVSLRRSMSDLMPCHRATHDAKHTTASKTSVS